MEPEKKSFLANKKVIAISVGAVVLGAGITTYGLSAYNNGLWPFPEKVAVKAPDEKKPFKEVETRLVDEPSYQKQETGALLTVRPAIQTSEQGDCTLTIKGYGETLEFKNSSRGVDGVLGCLDFNADVTSLKPGTYSYTLTFQGDTQSSTVEKEIVLE